MGASEKTLIEEYGRPGKQKREGVLGAHSIYPKQYGIWICANDAHIRTERALLGGGPLR